MIHPSTVCGMCVGWAGEAGLVHRANIHTWGQFSVTGLPIPPKNTRVRTVRRSGSTKRNAPPHTWGEHVKSTRKKPLAHGGLEHSLQVGSGVLMFIMGFKNEKKKSHCVTSFNCISKDRRGNYNFFITKSLPVINMCFLEERSVI